MGDRKVGKVLAMTALKFPAEVRSPDIIKDEIQSPQLEPEALALTSELLEQLRPKKFSIDKYADTYVENLREFIEAKVKGKEVVAPPPVTDEPQVINIMEALRKSVASAGSKSKAESSARKRRATKKKSG